jgi:integrase/recombinase XerD
LIQASIALRTTSPRDESVFFVSARNDYFFWSGSSKVPAAVSVWRRRLADVFDRAGIKNGHSHRLRDTFAVRMLEAGLSIENVSTLLGHASIKVTQRHYSPWVKTRQDALDREVLKALKSAATTK